MSKLNNYRIGQGFDVHSFAKIKNKKLILAGIEVASDLSLEAVSDGDVVLHTISDAILGAACLGDIGDFFPPQDKKSQNLDSKQILKFVLAKLKGKFKLVNLDITIIAEKPRLVSYKNKMKESLEKLLSCKEINIKIKSKEGLNILGGIEAISCMAIALLKKNGK